MRKPLLTLMLLFTLPGLLIPNRIGRATLPAPSAASAGRVISGRVTDDRGNGISGVTVRAAWEAFNIFLPLVQKAGAGAGRPADGGQLDFAPTAATVFTTTTDASGVYTFTNLGPSAYVIHAEKDGLLFAPAVRRAIWPAADQDFQIEILPPQIGPKVVVILPETNQYLQSVLPGASVYTFTQTTPQLQTLTVGSIIVSDAAATAPSGYLRKVVSITARLSGVTTLTTEPATLEEAILSGSLYNQDRLTPAQAARSGLRPGVSLRPSADPQTFYFQVQNAVLKDLDGNLSTTNDQVRANGAIALQMNYEFYLSLQAAGLQRLSFASHNLISDTLQIIAGVDLPTLNQEVVLVSQSFTPVTRWIGTAPVVYTPQMEVVVGADGSVRAGLSAQVMHQVDLRAGAQYTAAEAWSAIADLDGQYAWTYPHATYEAQVRSYLGPRWSLYLYGLAGPYAQATPTLEMKVTPDETPWWRLSGGAQAQAGFDVSDAVQTPGQPTILKLDEKREPALDVIQELTHARINNQAPNPPATPSPANLAYHQPLTTTLIWTASDPDGDPLTFDVYLEPGDNSPDVAVSTSQSAASYNPGPLTLGLTYFWQIIAADSENRLTSGPVWRFSTPAAPLSVGMEHTCAITLAGGIKCWGGNNWGQLGDDTTTERLTPVDVLNLPNGVKAVSAGGIFSCALTADGGVKCWGGNFHGGIGDDTVTDRHTPVDVIGLSSGAQALDTGLEHACVLTTAGGVKCWGSNSNGQLGDGTNTDRYTPVDVMGLTSGVIAISVGSRHTCAITDEGIVKCWGDNSFGQLGDGATTDRNTPVDVTGLTEGVQMISAGGYSTCAVTSVGGAKCWGFNHYGQVGDGTTLDRSTPVDVVGLTSGVRMISPGDYHTCALTTTGGVRCWGLGGRSGDGTSTAHPTPVDVLGITNEALAINTGYSHACALLMGGGVKCWGDRILGNGSSGNNLTPVDVLNLTVGIPAPRPALRPALRPMSWFSLPAGQ